MKKFMTILLLLLACVLLFAACDGNGGDSTTTTTTTTTPNPDDGQPSPPVGIVLVNADKSTEYSVVVANTAISAHRTEVRNFISAMQSKTGSSVKMALTQHNSAPTSDFEITVNVWKNRDDAAACYAETPYNNARIEIVGNRIVVTAFTTDALSDALDDLAENVTQDASGNWVLPATYSYSFEKVIAKSETDWSYMTKAEKEAFNAYVAGIATLPKFTGANLTTYDMYSLANEGYEIAFEGATKAEYEAYVAALQAAGFVKYSERTVSAGSDKPNSCNIYHTFTKDEIYVSTAWQGNLGVARIMMLLPTEENLPSLEPIPVQSTHTVTPTVAQMHLWNGGSDQGGGGMSYVIQMADGKFVIIDGGTANAFSKRVLLEYLEEKAAEAGMEKPVIAMWLFTHVHLDHIGVANGSSGVDGAFKDAKTRGYTIESIAYNFPDDANVPGENAAVRITAFETQIKKYVPNATIYTPRAGQVYYFTGMQMEILSTEEDVYPFLPAGETHNSYSVNCRLNFDGGKKFVFLADSTPVVNKQLADMYGDYLKSDVLQVAHHGLVGAEITCYQKIDPDICLWPTTELRFSGKYAGSGQTAFTTIQYTVGMTYQSGDALGNPTKPLNTEEGKANRWIRALGEYSGERERQHYHNSQTTIVNALDLTVTVDTSNAQ